MLNNCQVGGIFSAKEGACYASTEYLLCGLPVITTASKGGRHVWYTPQNSITVEATPEAVAAGVQLALHKLATGEFDRQKIRQHAVDMCQGFRIELVRKVQQLCRQLGCKHGGVDSNRIVDGMIGGAAGASELAGEAVAVVVEEGLLQELGSRNKLGLL